MEIDNRLIKNQVGNLRERLERWRADLSAAALEVTREGRQLVDDSALDVADRAVHSATKESLFRRAHELQRLLQRVEAALGRIRDGTFGECLGCGSLIAVKRLEAVPWTEYCVACQEKRERGELSEAGLSGNAAPARIGLRRTPDQFRRFHQRS